MNDTLAQTRQFAIQQHGAQMYGDQPYVTHLDLVVRILRKYGFDSIEQLQVGYLHDVIEDTPMTQEGLVASGFPSVVALAVGFCSDRPGPNRKARKALTYEVMDCLREGYLEGAIPHFPLGARAKLADRLANVIMSGLGEDLGLLRMYQGEHPRFRQALYVPGMADAMWVKLDYLLRP